jgi:hypothetical protein
MDFKQGLEQYASFLHRFCTDALAISRERLIQDIKADLKMHYPHHLILQGFSVYSQNEEDGILAAIFKTLALSRITFFEFGVQPGENNTQFLLMQGSASGVWFDQSLSGLREKLDLGTDLSIHDDFITLGNIGELCGKGLEFLGLEGSQLDFLSLDLDGNDYYILERILQTGIRPKVLCLEYNARFPLPMNVKIRYNEAHRWARDDYMGCSLQAWLNLLQGSYTLLACNLSGGNCFFVRNELAEKFVVYGPSVLYMPCRYYLSPFHKGHRSSTKFLEAMSMDRVLGSELS